MPPFWLVFLLYPVVLIAAMVVCIAGGAVLGLPPSDLPDNGTLWVVSAAIAIVWATLLWPPRPGGDNGRNDH